MGDLRFDLPRASRLAVTCALTAALAGYVANCVAKYRLGLTGFSESEEPAYGFRYPTLQLCTYNMYKNTSLVEIRDLLPLMRAEHFVMDGNSTR